MKKFRFLILALFLSFLLVGCGQETTTEEITQTTIEETTQSIEETTTQTTEATYTLTLVKGGDLSNEVISGITYGETVNLVSPERIGYTFTGWVLDTTVYTNDIDYIFTEDITLTASYDVNEYQISFNINGGSTINPARYDYGEAISAPADPTKEGFTFGGWYSDIELTTPFVFDTMPAEDITLSAKWDPITFSVTFRDYDNTVIESQTVSYGGEATAPADPERLGYTFTGWDTTFDNVMSDLEVIAQFSINQYTISFIMDGGLPINDITQDYGTDVLEPTPEKAGYTFDGWYSDGEFNNPYTFSTMSAANITVYAKWLINSYTVTFYDYDGTLLDTQIIEYLSSATAPANPERVGHTFDSWSTTFDLITQDLMVTATYTVNQYTITFNCDGGTALTPLTADYGTVVNLPNPTKTDNYFLYWEDEVEVSNSYTVTGDVTLLAVWKDVLEGFAYTTSGTSLTITGYSGSDSEVIIPDTYGIYTVEYIGNTAFINDLVIEKVTIGVNVYRIGTEAFNGCSNLEEVVFKNNNQLQVIDQSAFYACTSLRKINLESCDNLYFIGAYGFYNNTSLEYVYIKNVVDTIAPYTFSGCTSLIIFAEDSVEQPNWGTYWNQSNRPIIFNVIYMSSNDDFKYVELTNNDIVITGLAEGNEDTIITIPELIDFKEVTMISDFAFYDEDFIIDVYINRYLTDIGYSAFMDCDNLINVYISATNNLTVIGSRAFSDCTNLGRIQIENCNSLTTIKSYAFQNCDSLLELYINTSVTSMENDVTYDADNLSIFVYAATEPATWSASWNSGYAAVVYDFDYQAYENDFYFAVQNDGDIYVYGYNPNVTMSILVVPNGLTGVGAVEYIADCAFAKDQNITQVMVQHSLLEIGEYAFFDCDNLGGVTISSGSLLDTISYRAFYQCRDMDNFNLENATFLTTIETGAFSTTGLTSIKVPISVTVIENYAFSGSLNITLYIEAATQPAGWETSWNFNGYPVVWDYLNA